MAARRRSALDFFVGELAPEEPPDFLFTEGKPVTEYDDGKISFLGCDKIDDVPAMMHDFCELIINAAQRYIEKKLKNEYKRAASWSTAFNCMPFLTCIHSEAVCFHSRQASVDLSLDLNQVLGIDDAIGERFVAALTDRLSFSDPSKSPKLKDHLQYITRTVVKHGAAYELLLNMFATDFEQTIEFQIRKPNPHQKYALRLVYTKRTYAVTFDETLYERLKSIIVKRAVTFTTPLRGLQSEETSARGRFERTPRRGHQSSSTRKSVSLREQAQPTAEISLYCGSQYSETSPC